MPSAKVYLSSGKPIELGTFEALENLIPEIKAAKFTEIWIETPKKTSMVLLTNRSHGHLSYFFNDGDFLAAINKRAAANEKEVVFCTLSGCGVTELPARLALPIDDALKAMLHFFQTQSLPDWIEWE